MSYLIKGRAVAVRQEATFSDTDDTTVFADSEFIDYTVADISTDIENIEREVVRKSLVNLQGIRGQETSSGTITVELSADDVVNGVNGDYLFENGFGKVVPSVLTTTVSAATTASAFTLTDVTGLEVGQVIEVDLLTAGTGKEYVTIVTITGNDVTVNPALSVTPTAADTVEDKTTYLLNTVTQEVKSLGLLENLTDTGAGATIDYTYGGVMVSEVALDFTVGSISTAAFSIGGATFKVDDTTPNTAPTACDVVTPVVGKNATFEFGGVSVDAQDVTISVSTEITDIQAVTTDGIANKLGVSKEVTGSFKVEYSGADLFKDYKNNVSTNSLRLVANTGVKGAAAIAGVFLPKLELTNVSRSEDGGILYDNIEFRALSPDCLANEQAISLFFV